jgi:uncharacterized protein with FMN-binding domain
MKRLLAVLLIFSLSVGAGACTKKGKPGTETSKGTAAATKSTAAQSPASATPSPTKASQSSGKATPSPGAATPTPGKATPTKTVMKDGTYDAKGDPWEMGQEQARIVVKNGRISQATLIRLDTTGKEVDYTKFDGKQHEGKLYPDLKKYKTELAKKIVEKQSAEVDAISGATTTTKNWKVAAERAIAKAQKS